MLDVKFIRDNTDLVREALEKRQDSAPLDEILKFDSERRQKILELENFRHARKEASKERQADKDTGRNLRDRIKGLEDAAKT